MTEEVIGNPTKEERQQADNLLSLLTTNLSSHDDLINRYSQTSDQYDKLLPTLEYSAPAKMAETLSRLFPINREDVYIFDVAAGTGLCAEECHKSGFRRFDAVDASPGMLEEARKKGLYGHCYTAMLGTDSLDIQDDTYDVAMLGGMPAWIMRELPLSALDEMIRLVKPGGYVVSVSNSTSHDTDSNYYKHTIHLEALGKWTKMEFQRFPNFLRDMEGAISVHKVC